jgi:hypothetical protein
MQAPPDTEVRWFRGTGWCQAKMHIDMMEQAVEWGADRICILGSDQIHPEDMFVRLMEHLDTPGIGVISAAVPSRAYVGSQEMKPFQRMAWLQVGDGRAEPAKALDLKGVPCPVQIDFIGTGVVMFETSDLLRLKKPWLSNQIADGERLTRKANADVAFVHSFVDQLGLSLFVDPSIEVRHLHTFEIDETFSERFADWAEPGKGDPSICRYPEST